MRKLSLAGFILLALVACVLFFLFAQVVHADSPNPHGGHPPVVSNGQGQVDKGRDPVPHVNYGLHKGQNKPDDKKDPPADAPSPVDPPVPANPIENGEHGNKPDKSADHLIWWISSGGMPQAD